MQHPKLQLLYLLPTLASSSAIAIVTKPIPQAPHIRRDHGNPFQPVQSPKAQTSTVAPPAISEIPATTVIAASSSTLPNTIQPTTAISASTSSFSHFTSVTTATSSSSSMRFTIPTSSTAFKSSSAVTTTTTLTATAITPPDTSISSSSQPTTLIILCILSLILGLVGLTIFILAFMRRQARRKRNRGMKREVELLKVDVRAGVPADVNAVYVAGQSSEYVGGGKWEEAREKVEDEDEWERERERGEALPPYYR